MLKHWIGVVLVPVAVLIAASAPGNAQSAQHAQWVGTWAASPMLAVGGFAVRPFAAVTLREVVHISNGGEQIRVRFTNEFGLDGLTITLSLIHI